MKTHPIRTLRLVADAVHESAPELGSRGDLKQAEHVVAYMADAFAGFPDQEQAWVIPLDMRGRPLGRHLLTVGTATSTLVHPREVFRVACVASASAIVLVHNHPSGDPTPSSADLRITRQIRDAGEAVQIPLLDHVIIGEARHDPHGLGHYSFKAGGMI